MTTAEKKRVTNFRQGLKKETKKKKSIPAGAQEPQGWIRKSAIDKVAILGTASSLPMAPWDDKSVDIWACQPVITHPPAEGKRIDLIFELHPMEYWVTIIDRLNKCKIPVYMQDQVPQIPLSMKYPKDEIFEAFKNYLGQKYQTSTISWMFALAIYMGYKHIYLYGIHMSADEEYSDQRQAMEFWVGVANGMGIAVYNTEESAICKTTFLYGYEYEPNIAVQARNRRDGLQLGVSQLEDEVKAAQTKLDEQRGAVKDCDYWNRKYRN